MGKYILKMTDYLPSGKIIRNIALTGLSALILTTAAATFLECEFNGTCTPGPISGGSGGTF